MATKCASFSGAAVLRFTRLDACCRPSYGECGTVVTDGVISVSVSSEVEEGDETNVTKINGKLCASRKTDDVFKWSTVEIEFCVIDPDAIGMMNANWPKVYDAFGNTVGYDVTSELGGSNYALEIWPIEAGTSGDACTGTEGSGGGHGYILFPCLSGGAPGDLEINGEDSTSFTFTGTTKASGTWGVGPYPVQLDEAGVPGPLVTPLPSNAHYRVMSSIDVSPPTPPEECGCTELIRPTPPPADLTITGVTGESPRRTVRLRADNHGFGPVTINWGDGTATTTASDGVWTNHTYAADGDYTITVADQQTPGVVVTRQVTIPLESDTPTVVLTAEDPDNRMTITAAIHIPDQAPRSGTIDWGDGTTPQAFTVDATGDISLEHTYTRANIYTVTVTRSDLTQFANRQAITVPVADSPTVTHAETGLTTTLTIDNHGNGPVAIDWGDGATSDGPDAGTAPHTYAAAGTYSVRVSSRTNPAAATTVSVTVA